MNVHDMTNIYVNKVQREKKIFFEILSFVSEVIEEKIFVTL